MITAIREGVRARAGGAGATRAAGAGVEAGAVAMVAAGELLP